MVEGKARGDQVDVEPGSSRGLNERGEIGASKWFATGEVELHDAESGGFVEDTCPRFRGKFVCTRDELLRIGAVDAVERAAVGEFGDEGERIGEGVSHWPTG